MEMPKASKLHHKPQNKAVTTLTQSDLFLPEIRSFIISSVNAVRITLSYSSSLFLLSYRKKGKDVNPKEARRNKTHNDVC